MNQTQERIASSIEGVKKYVLMSPPKFGSKEDAESVLRIESKPWESFKDDVLTTAAEADEGDETGPDTVSFSDPSQVSRILTQKRLELIETVMLEEPESMRELARMVDRNPKEVNDDVHLLEDYGIISLEPDGRSKRPVIPYDRIEIEVTLELNEPSESGGNSRLAVQ
ncbi:HVO_A0114 family putative DNA-binding protein [Haloplanus rubicundus]|uniref:HVO_A0114 family putative DNA-binding protein n=1 Tax=Haloplanus rubicundus TaxID=1547898 RepID=UPI001300A9E1|nr:transcriptional regulator [Haloplanus rubicundus]